MFLLKEKGYYKQAIEILYKMLEAAESKEDTAEIIYELAETYFFSGNIERSIHYIDKLLDIAPNHIDAIKLKIKLLDKNNIQRVDLARKLYTLTNKPEDLKIYLALLNKAKMYKDTIAYINTSAKDYCYQEIAEAYYAMGQYENVKNTLCNQNNLNEYCELLLAKVCYAINDEDSLKLAEHKLAKSNTPEVIKFIMRVEFDLMNYGKVITLADKLENLYNNPDILYLLGISCLYTKHNFNAKKYFNILCEKTNEPKHKFALALSYIQSNQTTLAIESVTNSPAYLKIITLLLNEKAISKNILIKEFLTTFDIFSHDELALLTVIDISLRRKALDLADDLLKISHNRKNLRYKYYEIKLLIAQEKYKEAEEYLEQYKSNENFILLYAELLNAQNNFSTLESLLDSKKSFEKNEFEQCCYYYARILESKGDYERAIDIAQKGLDFVNNYSEIYYLLLYSLYKHLGEKLKAIDCLEKAANANPDLRPKLITEEASL